MKRILSLVLACLFLLGLVSCGEEAPPPTDEVLLERARELIPMTAPVNRLFYEEGIPYCETGDNVGVYYPADAAQLSLLGFVKVADILSYMKDVWSEDYVQQIEGSAIFKSVVGDNGVSSYAYCYDSYDKNGNFVCVMVNSNGLPIKTDPVTYDLDSLRVVSKSAERARITLTATVSGGEGQTKDVTVDVLLVPEGDTWMLASGTAVKFPTHG